MFPEESANVADQARTRRTYPSGIASHRPRKPRNPVCVLIGEPTEYVLNQLLDTVLAEDKEFLPWRGEYLDSYGPGSAATKKANGPGSDRVRTAPAPDTAPNAPEGWTQESRSGHSNGAHAA